MPAATKSIALRGSRKWLISRSSLSSRSPLSYIPMHAMLKNRNMQRKIKVKRIKILLNMITSVFLGDVWIIWCTSKVIALIKQLWLCVSVFNFLISQIVIIWDTYTLLLCFIYNTQTLCYFWYMCKYNVIWPSQRIHVLIYAH